jgi:hypothetical protein
MSHLSKKYPCFNMMPKVVGVSAIGMIDCVEEMR